MDAVLARTSLTKIVEGSHPGHELPPRLRTDGLVAKGDHIASVGQKDAFVPITRQRPRRIDRRRPGLAFILGEAHHAAPLVAVLAHDQHE